MAELSQGLPDGWIRCRLGEGLLSDIQPGFACGVHNDVGEGIAHLRPMNVNTDGRIDLSVVKYVPKERASRETRLIQQGDVLFNNTNSAELVGKTAYYSCDLKRAFSNHMTRLRCEEVVLDPVFCALALHQKWREGHFLEICNRHVSQASISRGRLEETELLLPPLAEQKRIVAKVEKLLTSVEKVRTRLDRIPELLSRFRQSVLSAAVSGTLTEDWREAQGNRDEPGLERRSSPTSLPDNWSRRRLGDFIARIESGKNFKCPEVPVTDGTVGLVKISAVTWDRFNPAETKTVTAPSMVDPDLFINEGDLLVSRANTLELVGASVIVDRINYRIMLSDKVWRIHLQDIDKHYVHFFLKSSLGRKEIESRASGNQLSMRNISQKKFRDMELPVPPPAEQCEIARRVGCLLRMADGITARYRSARGRADMLVQSILAKAFRGELVETEAELARREGGEYETAQQLLTRAKAEREEQSKPTRKVVRKTMKKKVSGRQASRFEPRENRLLEVLLKTKGKKLTPEQLLRKAGLTEDSVDDFFEELRALVEAGKISETRPDKIAIYLEAVAP